MFGRSSFETAWFCYGLYSLPAALRFELLKNFDPKSSYTVTATQGSVVKKSRRADGFEELDRIVGCKMAYPYDTIRLVTLSFGSKVPADILSQLQVSQDQVIGQLELMPVAGAMQVWRDRMLHRRVFVFVDN